MAMILGWAGNFGVVLACVIFIAATFSETGAGKKHI
jgi:hypothetical protein